MVKKESKYELSPFGTINGMVVTSCFLAPALMSGAMIFWKWDAKISMILLIQFMLAIRFGTDWFFWTKIFPNELSSLGIPKVSGSRIKDIILADPMSMKAANNLVMDFIADGILVFCAIKTGLAPIWVGFAVFVPPVLSALIQGIIIDRFNREIYRRLSMIVTVFAVVIALGLNGIGYSSSLYVNTFGLHHFDVPMQAFIIIFAKMLLSGTSNMSKAIIAWQIQIITQQGLAHKAELNR